MTTIPAVLALAAVLQGTAVGPVHVEVAGVSGALRDNIRAHLSLVERAGDTAVEETTVRALYDRAPSEIRLALRPFGYYRPTIQAELLEQGSGWLARYRVRPGPPVRYARVDVQLSGPGADDPLLRGVLPAYDVREGARLRHPAWEEAKQTLLNEAASHGYLDARITRSRVEVDTTALSARAVLAVETGPRYRFGEPQFSATPFTPGFLDRYVLYEPGEPFDLEALMAMQRALSASDYFRVVHVTPERDAADSLMVPIGVELELQRRNSYTIGAGYGTDTGVRVSASGSRRWLNPYGHRLQGESRASFRSQSLSFQYVIPLPTGPSDRIAATGVGQREAFEGLESRRIFARAELDQEFGRWRQVLSARLTEEWSKDGTETRTRTLLIPEASWTWAQGDQVLYPRRGYRLQLGVSGATTAVLSDVSFLQTTADVAVAQGLYSTGRILLRLNAGATWVNDFLDLPVSLRLFAGGDRSVRGFAYRSIGPVGSDGTVIGGRHRIVGSVELEQMVYGGFGLAVFTDVGNVFDNWNGIAAVKLEQGAGFGVRWRSPIGPVRLDLAWPVSRGGGPRVHFVVGGLL